MNDSVDSRRPLSDRLDSWKRIAAYLNRDVSTVQRWERREGMPVHRHLHDKQGSVFAYAGELDGWWTSRRSQLTQDAPGAAATAAEAQPVQPQPAEPQPAAYPPSSGSVSVAVAGAKLQRIRQGALTCAVILLIGILIWLVVDRASAWRDPLGSAKFSRLSGVADTAQAAAISPNGTYVAFLASQAGRIDAWVGRVGEGNYRNVTQGSLSSLVNASIRTLGFSTDSALVSIWNRKGDGTHPGDVSIFAAPTAGGPPVPYLPDVAEYDWSRDGQKLVYHTTAPGDPLFVREGKAAEARQIYRATAGVHCHFPIWSTDGTAIYFVQGVPPDDWDLWRISAAGTGLTRLTHHDGRVTYPVLLDRRTLLYLVNDPDGSGPRIYGLDPERPTPHRLTSGLDSFTSLAGSADGRRLIATTANPHSSLWRLRVRTGDSGADVPTFLTADALAPRLGRDMLVFISSRDGRPGIWTTVAGVTREIWHSGGPRISSAPSVSPDSSHIAFTVDDGVHASLVVIDQDGAHPHTLADSLTLQGNPVWSPEGRSVVIAMVQQGEPRLTRVFLDGRPPVALLGEYSTDPVWSTDGSFLVYSGRDIGTTFPLRAAAADGRPYAIPSLLLTRGARRLVVAKDAPALLVLRGDMDHRDIWRIDLRDGAERRLTTLPPDFIVKDFDLSADGAELILNKVADNSDMVLIERSQL